MNSLGLGWRPCADALHAYWRAIRRVARTARDAPGARHELDTLLFDLEVDVHARATESGRSRMTPVESAVLHPALTAAWRKLEGISPRDPPDAWQPPLESALATVRGAVPALRAWQPAKRRRSDGARRRRAERRGAGR